MFSNKHFKEYEVPKNFNFLKIEEIIKKILKLTESVNPDNTSWTSITTQIAEAKVSELFDFFHAQLHLIHKDTPKLENILDYLNNEEQKFKDNQMEEIDGYIGERDCFGKKYGNGIYKRNTNNENLILFGKYKNDQLNDGLSIYNNKSFYYGNYNKPEFDFRGIYYPDINKHTVNIGIIRFSQFVGISLTQENDSDKVTATLITENYQIKVNDINEKIMNFVCTTDIRYKECIFTYKENSYLTCLKPKDKLYTVYFNVSPETRNVICYTTGLDQKIRDETKVKIVFSTNSVYIGHLSPDDLTLNDEQGTFLIRIRFRSDYKFKIIGKFVKGNIIKGKVFLKKEKEVTERKIFEGDFSENLPSKGNYYFKNGDLYEGDFKNFKMDGKGKYVFENGETYDGDFKNNLPAGTGYFKDYNGNSKTVKIEEGGGVVVEQ